MSAGDLQDITVKVSRWNKSTYASFWSYSFTFAALQRKQRAEVIDDPFRYEPRVLSKGHNALPGGHRRRRQ